VVQTREAARHNVTCKQTNNETKTKLKHFVFHKLQHPQYLSLDINVSKTVTTFFLRSHSSSVIVRPLQHQSRLVWTVQALKNSKKILSNTTLQTRYLSNMRNKLMGSLVIA